MKLIGRMRFSTMHMCPRAGMCMSGSTSCTLLVSGVMSGIGPKANLHASMVASVLSRLVTCDNRDFSRAMKKVRVGESTVGV